MESPSVIRNFSVAVSTGPEEWSTELRQDIIDDSVSYNSSRTQSYFLALGIIINPKDKHQVSINYGAELIDLHDSSNFFQSIGIKYTLI